MSGPSPNFGRVCRVIVGKNLTANLGAGLLIEGFKIMFTVEQTLRGPPNTANVQIYNLNPTNEGRIKKEFDDIVIQAGYIGNPRVIFRGSLKFASHYREGTDWITDIAAADGDRIYTEGHVGLTLSAGATPQKVLDQLLSMMTGIRRGVIELPRQAYTRGKTVSGPIRRVLDQLARDYGASWSIQNGVLNIVRADSVLPGQAIVVNAKTGMLGAPEVHGKGIKVKMELNPMAEPNKILLLDNNNIKIQAQQLYSGGPKVKAKKIARLDPDGRYKIYKLKHQGDTLGPEWYTEAESIGIGQAIPKGSA